MLYCSKSSEIPCNYPDPKQASNITNCGIHRFKKNIGIHMTVKKTSLCFDSEPSQKKRKEIFFSKRLN